MTMAGISTSVAATEMPENSRDLFIEFRDEPALAQHYTIHNPTLIVRVIKVRRTSI